MSLSAADRSSSPTSRPRFANGTDALRGAVMRHKGVAAHADLLRQGEGPDLAHVLLEGLACRYRMLSDGRRQITAVLVPGDVCELEAVLQGHAAYGVGALTQCTLGEVAVGSIAPIEDLGPEMRQVVWRQVLRDEAIAREWLLSLGRKSALERLAHFLCELWTRLRTLGLADANRCALGFTQGELADILGLSNVHINRTLQELRATGLIQLKGVSLDIFDHAALAHLAGFDPRYLHVA